MSITPFSGDPHDDRVAQLEKLAAMSQQLTAHFQETLGLQITEVSGELRAVRTDLDQAREIVHGLEQRTKLIEASVENGYAAPVFKMFYWAGISEQGSRGGATGSLLTHVCEHFGNTDKFAKRMTVHPHFPKGCGSYSYELWAWYFDVTGQTKPEILREVFPVRFDMWQTLKRKLERYKEKYC